MATCMQFEEHLLEKRGRGQTINIYGYQTLLSTAF